MEIFLQNLERIAEHNIRYRNGEVTYTLGMNRFGDMTHPEFVARFNGYKSNGLAKKAGKAFMKPANPTMPETALAVSRLPTSELPLLVTRFLDPVMRLPLLMLLPPSVPLLLPSMLLICLSSSTIQVSTLRGTAEMVTTTWTTQFWP